MVTTIHTVFGFTSLALGTAVIFRRKGTPLHVLTGRLYVLSMIALNVSAFGIYKLTGRFGIFHWIAVFGLITIAVGISAIYFRRKLPNWIEIHYECMAWSYVGLLAATSNEAFVHLPVLQELAKSFPVAPLISLLSVIVCGGLILYRRKKTIISNVRAGINA